MQRNNHEIRDYDEILDAKFGIPGTPSRIEAEDKAWAFYTGKIVGDARKQAHITQAELGKRIGADRAYISKIENGKIEPKVSTFYRIANAMGMSVELSQVLV
jgi:DNA-binding XRE family transcriptional regulator